MPVEDVFNIEGRGTVATGRVERGILKKMEEVEIVGIRRHREDDRHRHRNVPQAPRRGARRRQRRPAAPRHEEGRRRARQVIAKPGSIKPHKKFKAEIYVLSKEEGGRHTPFFTNYRPQFYFRTTDVTGIGQARRRRRDGHARRQRLRRSRARSRRSPWRRPCASPSAKAARPSARAVSPRSSTSQAQVIIAESQPGRTLAAPRLRAQSLTSVAQLVE